MITHDSVTLTDGTMSHRWTDGEAFAYHWHEGASVLTVGALDQGRVGPRGWTFASPGAVQRAYVRRWSVAGPLFLGVNTSDPGAAWSDPADVAAVVRSLVAEGWTADAFLFQFDTARFVGREDGQAVIFGKARSGRPSTGGRPLVDPGDESLVPNDEPLPALAVDSITADSLAEEISKALLVD